LQELKKKEKLLNILPTGMVNVNGKFNENPTDLDLHKQTDFLITIGSGGRRKFVKISVKPPEEKMPYEKKPIFFKYQFR